MPATVIDSAHARSDYADPSYRSVREVERDTKPLYQRSDSAYRAQLSAWYNQIARDYRACIPQNFNFSLNFADGQKSDWDLYREAMGFYNSVTANWYRTQQNREEKPKRYHLRETVLPDGSAYLLDMNGHSEADVKVIRRNDGHYDFIGTNEGFERLYSRAGLIRGIEDGQDGIQFRDIRKKVA